MQSREEIYNRTQVIQENIKNIYDKRTKEDHFELGDLVLRWDSRNEDKVNMGSLIDYGRVLRPFRPSEEIMLSYLQIVTDQTYQGDP
jgi:hypothetical protein